MIRLRLSKMYVSMPLYNDVLLVLIVIVGNKCDLEMVSQEEGISPF